MLIRHLVGRRELYSRVLDRRLRVGSFRWDTMSSQDGGGGEGSSSTVPMVDEEAMRALSLQDMTDDMTAEQKKAIRDARKAMKELEKKLKKERKQAAAATAAANVPVLELISYVNANDEPSQVYGDYQVIRSLCPKEGSGRKFTRLESLDESKIGEEVWVRARIQNIRAVSRNAFFVLRQQFFTAQAIASPNDMVPPAMIKWALKTISRESIVDIKGKVMAADVKACTQTTVEIAVQRLYVVSRAAQPLPFNLEDAARPHNVEGNHVTRENRLDHRVVDLRVQANQAIFHIQSAVSHFFRDFLTKKNFVEIHSPKLIGGASEGGSEVFRVQYFDRQACLAQSPQLYKQMAICGDMERVFEIGPVFRAEKSNTHRHLTEFTGLDFEMVIDEHYMEIVRMIDGLFASIFEGLQTRFAKELEAVQQLYPFEPFKFRPSGENLVLEFPQGIALLREHGIEIGDYDDMNSETERTLGKIVREKYDTDFFILTKFPAAVRPFYTMPMLDDPHYSNSFDVFMRGEEIISGAQRIHDVDLLRQRIQNSKKPIEEDSIRDYIDAFKFGAPPHGGAGVGLERVVMLFMDIGNVRETSMFPRDVQRLAP